MPWGRYAALGALAGMVGGLIVLQIPVLRGVRGWAWTAWGETVATLFNIGPLNVPNNVAEQLAALQADNARLRAELHDYQRVREQLGIFSTADFTALPAHVIAQSLDAYHARVVINRGAHDGVTLGAPAVVNGSGLVGLISELHDATAVLTLLFHPTTSLPAEVLFESGTSRGLLHGVAFTSLALSSVPRDHPLAIGQEVVTVYQHPTLPGGLLIGKITSVANEPHEPWQEARVAAHFDPDQLWAVAVLVPQ